MTARTGMTNLILRLRGMVDAGTANYAVNGVAYWTDDHLQTQLDAHRVDLSHVPLEYEAEYEGGTAIYKDYYAPIGNFEEHTESDASVFSIEDGDGDEAGTANYTMDYQRGVVRFSSDQGGTAYYIRGRSYNLNSAAAAIWRMKAAHYVTAYDVKTENQTLSRSQMRKAALEMAGYYERQVGVQVMTIRRGDLL